MWKPTRQTGLVAAAVAAALCGCSGGGGEPSAAPSTARSFVEATIPAGPSVVIGEVPEDLVAQVVADAAERAGVDVSEVRIKVAEPLTWNDGSIGCPEPGMVYTQALVPGYRVVVEAGGKEMSFHATESGEYRFCENPQPQASDPNE